MTQDEITHIAREAGLGFFSIRGSDNTSVDALERFFNLAFAAGATHEREACEEECVKVALRFFKSCDDLEQFGADGCAAAIRARSTNLCQKSAELVEANCGGGHRHRYAGSFGGLI